MVWQNRKTPGMKPSVFNGTTKPISRVLCQTIIYLGLLLPIGSSDTTRERDGPPLETKISCSPIRSCSRWGLHSRIVTYTLVSSYLAFPPLPDKPGGISLLHFPQSRLHWVLPSTLPYGARTFLSRTMYGSDCLAYSHVL